MEKKIFDNAERRRYYGIRIGDIVEENAFGIKTRGEVMGYGLLDNNKVYANVEGDLTIDFIPEWCTIITRVEDRTDRFKDMKFLMVTDKNGYRDYEITGFFSVHRACVAPNIKVGDIFNVYYDKSSKHGVEWKGDLKTSLIDAEVLFHNINAVKN